MGPRLGEGLALHAESLVSGAEYAQAVQKGNAGAMGVDRRTGGEVVGGLGVLWPPMRQRKKKMSK